MKKVIWSVIFSFAIFVSIGSISFAQDTLTTTLTPSADVTLVDDDSGNYGSDSTLDCEHDEDTKAFLIKFDLGVIPSNAQIQTATLALTQTFASGDDISINAYKVVSSWSESSVSGNDRPGFDSGVTYGVLGVDSSSGEKSFPQNFSDLVQSWIVDGNTNFGLYFEATSEVTYIHKFGSRESINKPTLNVTYLLPDEEGPVISDVDISEITSTGVKIAWQTDEEATGYVDYGESGTYGIVVGSETLSISHLVEIGNLKPDTTYHFRVRSEDVFENESRSEDRTFKTLPDGEDAEKDDEVVSDKISPPRNLKLTTGQEDGVHYVELEWEHSEDEGIDGYRIYRSKEDSTSYVLLTEIGPNKTSYKDEDVEVGETYFYVVRTVEGDEESADSNEEEVTIYANDLEAELSNWSFWKGFIIFNLVVLPIFIFLYLRYKKKSKNLKLLKKKKKS